MNHLDVVTGTFFADPVTARLPVCLGSSLLEDFFDSRPGSLGTTRHERRAVTGTLFTTRNTRSNKEETLSLELFGATVRVRVVRVTAIDDDITGLEEWNQLADERIDGGASLDEEDNFARCLEL